MASVVDVANYILKVSKEDPEDEEYELISHMKLQKLIYYCQGFSLALFDTPLFPEPIEAWKHGPVCPRLYHELKYCGSAPVSVIGPDSESRLTREEQRLISDVYWEYGQYAAWKLRKMTHDEIPWKETVAGTVISPPVIKDFFVRNFIMVPPEDMPPTTEAEKEMIQAAIADAEKSGEINLSEFCL
ncbi:MAG: DUF4065 domain-containing protein [Treponema sp.]|jgi:uncharacterized phage-associated protein|nr:DUF4065 domain-containing protein [Treponema sp.]